MTRRSWDDGAHEDTQYQTADLPSANADQTKTTDAAGKWRVLATDGLGRLIQVREAPSANEDTIYAYDALDNLLTVSHMVGASVGQSRTFTYDGIRRLLTANNPESGTISYAYDDNGNLTQKTDARGVVTTMGYDGLNRPLTKSYSGGGTSTPSVTWVWDTEMMGKLTSVESGISKMRYTYDPAGRIATSVQRTDGIDYSFEYRYHKGWGLRQVKYPSQRWVRYAPDMADRVVTIEGLNSSEAVQKTYWSGVQYAPQGAPRQITLGNGLIEHWEFSTARQQPWEIRIGTAGDDGNRGRWQFDYGGGFGDYASSTNNGNIVRQWNYTPNRIQAYTYDAVNRLASVSESGTGGWNQSYSYDRYGNRWVSANNGLTMDPRTPDALSDINAANNRLTGSNYAYDDAGNQTTYGGWTLGYDAENRVSSSQPSAGSQTTYAYDGDGRRVKKTTNGASTWFVYDASGNLAAEYAATGPAGGLVTSYVTTDHLGSTRLVTDASGNVVSRHDYLPFGEEINAGVGGRTIAMGFAQNPYLGITPTQRFTGKERDEETGLDYFGARYFSGVQGRFTGADVPFADQYAEDPQSWNLYTYARNNPLKLVDDNGDAVRYADERLRTISDARRLESPSYNVWLQGFEGQNSPDLLIQYGPTPDDPDGSHTNGIFRAAITPSIQNCSTATDCQTIPARLNSGVITINDSLQNNDDATSNTLAHEVSHANDARTNPGPYSTEPIRNAQGAVIPHDNRPVEQRAIRGARQSNQEQQQHRRQQREQERQQREQQRQQRRAQQQREREERERRRREQHGQPN